MSTSSAELLSSLLLAYSASLTPDRNDGEKALATVLSPLPGFKHIRRPDGSAPLDPTLLLGTRSCILYVFDTPTFWADMSAIAAAVPRESIVFVFALNSFSYPDFQTRIAKLVDWQLPRLVWWSSNYTGIQGAVWFRTNGEPEVQPVGATEWMTARVLNGGRARTLVRQLLIPALNQHGTTLPYSSSSVSFWALKIYAPLIAVALIAIYFLARPAVSPGNDHAQESFANPVPDAPTGPMATIVKYRQHETDLLSQGATGAAAAKNLSAKQIFRLAALQKNIYSELGEGDCNNFVKDSIDDRNSALAALPQSDIDEYFRLRALAIAQPERSIATEKEDIKSGFITVYLSISDEERERWTKVTSNTESITAEDACWLNRTLTSHEDKLTPHERAALARVLDF
jgi:hypothetical protein